MQPLVQLLPALLLFCCMIKPATSDAGCDTAADVCVAAKADTIVVAKGCKFSKPIEAKLEPGTYRIIEKSKIPSAVPKPCNAFAIACDKTGSARFRCAEKGPELNKQARTDGYGKVDDGAVSSLTSVLSYIKESATKEELEQLKAAIEAPQHPH